MSSITDTQRETMMKNSLLTRRRNKVKKLMLTAITLCNQLGDSPKETFEEVLQTDDIDMPEWLENAAEILQS
jgi:hypothetical protein